MKILLLALYDKETMLLNHDEIGIASIASYIRENGYSIKLMGSYIDQLNFDAILEYAPQVIGMSVYRDSKDPVCDFSIKVKKVLPNVKIICGGAFATIYATDLLTQCNGIDYIVRGEGEQVFLELLRFFEKKHCNVYDIHGLTYRHLDQICHNEQQEPIQSLDSLPPPSRDILIDNKLNIATISTSRGCYGNCSFCESPFYWSNPKANKEKKTCRWRGKSVDNICAEMMHIEERYGIKKFYIISNSFEDPGGTTNIENFADRIIEQKRHISYQINLRPAFYRSCTDGLLDKLKTSGLCSVFTGIEAANIDDLRLYNKMNTCEDNEKFIELFRTHDINTCIGFININPYSTFKSLHTNLRFLHKYHLAGFFLMLSRLRVEKGTRIYRKIVDDGLWIESRNIYTDSLGYRHVDERIDKLVKFLNNYFYDDLHTSKLMYRIRYYDRYFLMYLSYDKRLATLRKEMDALDLINVCESEINRVFLSLNETATTWFEKVLNLAENCWDQKEAEHLTETLLSKNYLSAAEKELSLIKGKHYRTLLKANASYAYYVT